MHSAGTEDLAIIGSSYQVGSRVYCYRRGHKWGEMQCICAQTLLEALGDLFQWGRFSQAHNMTAAPSLVQVHCSMFVPLQHAMFAAFKAQ